MKFRLDQDSLGKVKIPQMHTMEHLLVEQSNSIMLQETHHMRI